MSQIFYAPRRALLINWEHRNGAADIASGALNVSGVGAASFTGRTIVVDGRYGKQIFYAAHRAMVIGWGHSPGTSVTVSSTHKRKYHNWSVYGGKRFFVWQNAGAAADITPPTPDDGTPSPTTMLSEGASGWVQGGRKARRKKVAEQDEKDMIAIMAFIHSGESRK